MKLITGRNGRKPWLPMLKKLRETYTQQEIADLLFVRERTVRRWENEGGHPGKAHQRNLSALAARAVNK